MKYISGAFALNLPCSLDTCGDWHASALDWSKLELRESDNSIFGEYGIERCNCVPEHTGEFNVANTLRALLDLLADGNFAVAQGARDDFICNDKYTDEFLIKCIILRNRFTHDYYKRDIAEADIIKFCHSEIIYLDIFLESSSEVVRLNYKINK